jgi:hypothetical protein
VPRRSAFADVSASLAAGYPFWLTEPNFPARRFCRLFLGLLSRFQKTTAKWLPARNANHNKAVETRPHRKCRIASLTFREISSNLLILFFIIWLTMPVGSPAPPSRVVRPWEKYPVRGWDFRAALPWASAKPMKDKGDYHS